MRYDMNFKAFRYILVLTLLILAIGCQNERKPADKSQQQIENIKIAGIYPITGKAATFGVWARNGAELAVEEINNAGGVNGTKLVHLVEDTQTSLPYTFGLSAGSQSLCGFRSLANPTSD